MSQNSLYYKTQLETKVSLLPEQITGDMDNHLLENLRTKVEKKVIENGIVLRVNRLIDYDYGIIDKTNFMGTTVFNVKYECFICSPIKGLELICKVTNIVKGFLMCVNGPIIIAIEFNNIDTQRFQIADNTIANIETSKNIDKGDHLLVSIISINHNMGEKKIHTICKLLDMASESDIKKYEHEQKMLIDESASKDDENEFI